MHWLFFTVAAIQEVSVPEVNGRVVDPAGSEIICMFGSGFGSKCSLFPTYGTVAISIKENRFKELQCVFFIVKI